MLRAEMGPRPRNFNVLLLGNRGVNLCRAHLQPIFNKTNVRLDFRPFHGCGRGLFLPSLKDKEQRPGSPAGPVVWLWNGGLYVVFSKVSQ
jgi:hypothetical protein